MSSISSIKRRSDREMVCNNAIELKGEICKYISRHAVQCPKCGARMRVHGTYCRTIEHSCSVSECTFRVLSCASCRETHREIPAWVMPFKRFSVEHYCFYYKIAEEDRTAGRGLCIPEAYRAIRIKEGFEHIKNDLVLNGILEDSTWDTMNDLQKETERLVLLAVNNFLWKQQYFV